MGYTTLMLSAYRDHVDIVQYLCSKDSEPDVERYNGVVNMDVQCRVSKGDIYLYPCMIYIIVNTIIDYDEQYFLILTCVLLSLDIQPCYLLQKRDTYRLCDIYVNRA